MNQLTFADHLGLDYLTGRATLTVEETAALLGLSRTATYQAVKRGDLPSRRLGRRILIPVPALRDWLTHQTGR